MIEFFWGLLQGGKTTTGALLVVLSSVLGALTPDDVALIQALLAGTNTAGTVVAGVGLVHKLIKAVQARRAAAA